MDLLPFSMIKVIFQILMSSMSLLVKIYFIPSVLSTHSPKTAMMPLNNILYKYCTVNSLSNCSILIRMRKIIFSKAASRFVNIHTYNKYNKYAYTRGWFLIYHGVRVQSRGCCGWSQYTRKVFNLEYVWQV
jgi:hypothetical protein